MPLDLSMIPDAEQPEAQQGGAVLKPQSVAAKKSKLDLSMIPDAGSGVQPSGKQQMISAYSGPPKWEELGLWDKLSILSNPATTWTGIKHLFLDDDPGVVQAKSMNSVAIANKLNVPPSLVYQHYDKIMRDPEITGMNFSGPGREQSGPVTRAYELADGLAKLAFPALIGAGLITAPLTTAAAVGAFTGISEGTKAVGALATGKKYHYGMETSEAFLPPDASESLKALVNMAEFFGSALATGGLIKGWNRLMPEVRDAIVENLFRDVITEYQMPKKIYVSPERVRALQLGAEDPETDMIKDLDLNGEQWRQALRMGIDIEVPAEKIITIKDKPWFRRLKEDLNKTKIFSLSPHEEVRSIRQSPPAGRPRPSGLLPSPTEEGVPGVQPGVSSFPPEPETPSSPPLEQTNILQATESPGQIKGEAGTAESTQAVQPAEEPLLKIQPLWPKESPPEGIDLEVWQKYNDAVEKAAQATSEAIEKRRVTELDQAKSEWQKEAEKLWKEDGGHAPVQWIIDNGGLNRQSLLAEFDEATVNALSQRHPGLVQENGKLSHTMVAFGHGDISTEQLVDLLMQAEPKEEFVRRYVQEKTQEFDAEHKIEESAITDEYLSMLETEVELLSKQMLKKNIKITKTKDLIRRTRNEIERARVSELLVSDDVLKAGIEKATRTAREALTAKDIKDLSRSAKLEEALRQLQRKREIIIRLKEQYRAQREIEKARKYFDRVAKSKTIDWDFKSQILDLLADHGIIARQDFPREGMPSLRQFVESLRSEGELVDISDDILDRNYRGDVLGHTYDELMDLYSAARQLEYLGRNRSKFLAEQKKRDIQEAVEDMVVGVSAIYGPKMKPPSGHLEFEEAKNTIKKMLELSREGATELIKPEVIVRMLDGLKPFGPVYENIFGKIKAAEDKEIKMGQDFMKRLQAIFEKIPAEKRRTWLDKKIAIEGLPEKYLTKMQMIMVALNSGNPGNRLALKEGSGPDPDMKWTDDTIQAITDKLSKQEWELVKDIWALVNELYEPLNEVHREMTGVPLKKVEGITVQTPYGEVEGMYFPLVFDPKQSKRAEQYMLAMAEKDMFANYYARPAPEKGFTIERKGGKMFPLLDFSVITKHINDVIHFVTHAKEIRDIQKLIYNPDLRAAIEQALWPEAYKQFGPWLQAIARPRLQPITTWERMFGSLRKKASIVIMGWKFITAAVQPLAATQAIDMLGLVPFMGGLKTFYAHPVYWVEFVKARSTMIATRYSQETLDREIAQFSKQFNPQGDGYKELMQKSFFFLMNTMDASVTYPTWLTAYFQGLNKFRGSEGRAIEYADQVVRLTQGSGATKDLPKLLQVGKEGPMSIFTMFQTFFNAFVNRLVERWYDFQLGNIGVFGLFRAFTWLVLVPSYLEESFRQQRFIGPKEYATNIAQYLASGFPLLRDAVNAILTDYDPKPSAAFGIFYELHDLQKAITAKDPKAWNIIKHSLMLTGYAFGLPTAQAVITMKALLDLWEGKDTSPADLFFRPPKKGRGK